MGCGRTRHPRVEDEHSGNPEKPLAENRTFTFEKYSFNARWPRSVPEAKRRGYDPSLERFTSPDTIVPTSTQGTQAWDRYAFVNNNPVRYNDPTGHFAFLVPMLVGAVLGGAIDAYAQYRAGGNSMESINWGKVAVSAGIGAVGGLVGAALIAPVAAAAGTVAAAWTGSAALGVAADFAVGATMSIGSNGILSTTESVIDHAIDGDSMTLEEVVDEVNGKSDQYVFYGTLGYGVGKTLGAVGDLFWTPPQTVAHLLNPTTTQKVIIGVAEAAAGVASNDELLQCATDVCSE